MAISDLARRVGVSVVGVATAAVLVAGCSSSGSGKPSTNSTGNTTPANTSTSTGSGGGTGSSTSSGGGGSIGGAFCSGFDSSKLANLENAQGIDQVAAAWDQYAKDAPSEIKPQVEEIDHFVHLLKDKNYTEITAMAQKVGTDSQAIAQYFSTHCHA